jgi:hypothetical protein
MKRKMKMCQRKKTQGAAATMAMLLSVGRAV